MQTYNEIEPSPADLDEPPRSFDSSLLLSLHTDMMACFIQDLATPQRIYILPSHGSGTLSLFTPLPDRQPGLLTQCAVCKGEFDKQIAVEPPSSGAYENLKNLPTEILIGSNLLLRQWIDSSDIYWMAKCDFRWKLKHTQGCETEQVLNSANANCHAGRQSRH